MRRRIRWRKWLVGLLGSGLVVALTWWGARVLLHRINDPPYRVIARLESPDRAYQCNIWYRPPPGILGFSPNLYRFELLDQRGQRLAGEIGDVYEDSAEMDDEYRVTWARRGLLIHYGNGEVVTCDFDSGVQKWTQYPVGAAEAELRKWAVSHGLLKAGEPGPLP